MAGVVPQDVAEYQDPYGAAEASAGKCYKINYLIDQPDRAQRHMRRKPDRRYSFISWL